MDKSLMDRLPSSLTLVGSQDCFSPSDVVDYLYTDSNNFQPCMSNCKRCSSGTDCQECGSYSDPNNQYYLFDDGSSPSCLESCDTSQNKFIVPGASVATCHECPVGQYYVEGSNPPQCTLCNSGVVWIEASTKLCRPCGSGCSSCTSDKSCQSCSDPNHFIQVDGGSCGVGCSFRQVKTTGPPKRCESYPLDCLECSTNSQCTLCDQNLTLKEGKCQPCSSGCLQCQSQGCTSCQSGMLLTNTKTCIPCPDNCIECSETENQGIKCSKCPHEFELKQNKCFQKQKAEHQNQHKEEDEKKKQIPKFKITKSNYKNSPSRIEIIFDHIVNSNFNDSNINVWVKTRRPQSRIGQNQRAVKIQKIHHERNSKMIKIYIDLQGMVEQGVLVVEFEEGKGV